jgi:sugar phosphate isomerase/epimerase
MRYGIAVWNYMTEGVSLCERVRQFASFGFDAVSFLPRQIVHLSASERSELAALLAELDLIATVHGKCDITEGEVETLADSLGAALYAVTLDAAWAPDSRGSFYDGAEIVAALGRIARPTRGTPVRFGIEDFPRDQLALDHFRRDLGPLLDEPRYGMLIDLGHMNIYLRTHAYYRGVEPDAYLRRLPVPLIELHVHDNDGRRDQHGPLGLGNADFSAVACTLRRIGFDGVSTIEIAPRHHGAEIDEAIPPAAESLASWRSLCETGQRASQDTGT